MNIVYLHQHFAVGSGSSGMRSYYFAKLLIAQGHKVTMICGLADDSGMDWAGGNLITRRNIEQIDVHTINTLYTQSQSIFKRIITFVKFMVISTWVTLRLPKYDVVFATSTPLTIGIPAIIGSVIRRKPFVFEVRDLWPEVPEQAGIVRNKILIKIAKLLAKLIYTRANHIIALSQGMKRGILKYGTRDSKVTVIPNSSDIEQFRVPQYEGLTFRKMHPEFGDRPLIVYAGALGRINGLEYPIRLAEQLLNEDSEICFLFIGLGDQKNNLITFADRLGVLNQNLFFMKPIARDKLPSVLSAATMCAGFVIPNPALEDNSSNKFFDALAAGKPVVINYGGWQADLLRETGAGIVLDPYDIESAANSLRSKIRDVEWLKSASIASSRLAEEQFDRRKHARQLERILLDQVEKRRSGNG